VAVVARIWAVPRRLMSSLAPARRPALAPPRNPRQKVIPMPNYHVTIHGADREVMAELGRAHHVDAYCQTLADEDTGYRVSALADEQTTVVPFRADRKIY
jgi:hypothetical protein